MTILAIMKQNSNVLDVVILALNYSPPSLKMNTTFRRTRLDMPKGTEHNTGPKSTH